MVTAEYTHIWDCCCDHGYLGTSLLAQRIANCIHFVDTVPKLLERISSDLTKNEAITNSCWQTHCIDAATLPLNKYSGNHLVIIAGIGGDLMTKLVEQIYNTHPKLTIDFILCPIRQTYSLRQKLIEFNFSLKDEVLLEDKHHFYEVLFVSSIYENVFAINPVGEKIWSWKTAQQKDIIKRYLAKMLNHYRRTQQGKSIEADNIVTAYESIRI